MNELQAGDVLDAAVQTLIDERCRRAYMHDMRGGLQAIYTSAVVELRSHLTYDAIREAQDLLCRGPVNLKPQDLVLGYARRWIMANGGRVEIPCASGTPAGLRLYYPLAAAA